MRIFIFLYCCLVSCWYLEQNAFADCIGGDSWPIGYIRVRYCNHSSETVSGCTSWSPWQYRSGGTPISLVLPRKRALQFQAMQDDQTLAPDSEWDYDTPSYTKVTSPLTYKWDWATQNGIQENASGKTMYKLFKNPGLRTVQLKVDDNGQCFNDDPAIDTAVINVQVSTEVDWMPNVYKPGLSALSSGLGLADFVVTEPWPTNYPEFLNVSYMGESPYSTPESRRAYLYDIYRGQDTHLYVVGAQHYRYVDDALGNDEEVTLGITDHLGSESYSVVFISTIYNFVQYISPNSGPASALVESITLHEPGTHDNDIGGGTQIDHCINYPVDPNCAFVDNQLVAIPMPSYYPCNVYNPSHGRTCVMRMKDRQYSLNPPMLNQ
jgi:hypothetical protein